MRMVLLGGEGVNLVAVADGIRSAVLDEEGMVSFDL